MKEWQRAKAWRERSRNAGAKAAAATREARDALMRKAADTATSRGLP